jgi:hypothetical protein
VKRCSVVAAALVLAGCATLDDKPAYLTGAWGGPHIGITFEGALGSIEYDCASGTIDSIVLPAKDGRFTARGQHREGQGGPIRVGQIFRAQRATYSGEVQKDAMTLNVSLEDGTALGPFTLTQGATPQITRCL